jgi:predicted pyridoxine 5'-phosphate oxidase superfamily flavin-nucleotide-binding protein
MAHKYLDVVTTPSVRAAQTRYYGRSIETGGAPERDPLGEDERAFIAARDSFYIASVGETGWPYIQHRGGTAGFLKVLGPHSLGFCDYRGNRQMITTGNVAGNDRVSLFLMDYPGRTRLKILGNLRVEDARANPDLVKQLSGAEERAQVERVFLIDVVSFDWNCPKYITPRFTAAEVAEATQPLRERIAALEAKLRALDPKSAH